LRDDAITTLGVGKNMVRSIRHWCLAAGILVESQDAGLRPTELGTLLLDDEGLPDGILLYAVLHFWEAFAPASETLAIRDLARQPCSPGRMFKIDESSLVERLEGIEKATNGRLSYGETAGLRQLYRRGRMNPTDALKEAYAAGGNRR